jgi:hypothetical protein
MSGTLRLVLVGSAVLIGTAALAQMAPPVTTATFDLSQLPAFKGTVQQFTTTPRGDIDGLILTDGTEVKTPPHLTAAIAAAIKAGDVVTIRGLKAASILLVAASSVTNDATGVAVVDSGPGGSGKKAGWPKAGPRPVIEGIATEVQGKVKAVLHGRKGELNGALLEDGTVVRLPPHEAARLASLLVAGQTVAVRGTLSTNAYGKLIEVRALGASLDKLSEVEGPPPGKRGGPKGPKG